jgi:hypothetical protein
MNSWRTILSWQVQSWDILAPGYSLNPHTYTSEEWNRIGDWLLTQGFAEAEVKEILLSTYMRWAADNRADENGTATLEDLQRYLRASDNERHLYRDVERWMGERT